MSGRLSTRNDVHFEFDRLPDQESSMLLNMGLTKMKYVDLSPDTTPFFAWGSDSTQTWPEKISATAKNIESSLRSDVLEHRGRYVSTLMKNFDNPILTDDMRVVNESTFIQSLSELDQRLAPEPDAAVLKGPVDESDSDGMSSVMDSIELYRTSIYQRELMLQLKRMLSISSRWYIDVRYSSMESITELIP